MSKYRLMPRDGNIPYQKITHGRRWVGRVVKHATEPHYLGIMGKLTVKASSANAAFEEVVAQHLGYRSADALHAHNAQVRQATRLVNATADELARRYLGGDTKILDEVCSTPQGTMLMLRGMTRSMRRK